MTSTFTLGVEESLENYRKKLAERGQEWRVHNFSTLLSELHGKVDQIPSFPSKEDLEKSDNKVRLTTILYDLAAVCSLLLDHMQEREEEHATLKRVDLPTREGIIYPSAYNFDGMIVLDLDDIKKDWKSHPKIYEAFLDWMYGQTMAMGPTGETLVYVDDYRRFMLNLSIID